MLIVVFQMRENSCIITHSPATRSRMTPRRCSPADAQEDKNDLVLPALRFELELFSSRTGSFASSSTHSMHHDCSGSVNLALGREKLLDSGVYP